MGEGANRNTRRRLTIDQAADQLGITVDAVRGRIKRGTITHERDAGRVYVILNADEPRPGRDQPTDRPDESGALISSKDETISVLREQLEAERQAHAEARRIIARLVERLPPQLEAPREPPEAPETVGEKSETVEPRSTAGGAHGAPERPWWRRVLGR